MLRDASLGKQALQGLDLFCYRTRPTSLMQTTDPDVIRPFLERYDAKLDELTNVVWNTDIDTWRVIPATRLRLPQRLQGGARRSMAATTDAAFVGALNQIIPRFAAVTDSSGNPVTDGLAEVLTDVVGADSFCYGSDPTKRFTAFVANGKLGPAFAAAWGRLRTAVSVLGEAPIEGALASPVGGAGHIPATGEIVAKLQHVLTEEKEDFQAVCLKEMALTQPRDDRGRTAFMNCDRNSAAWLRSAPTKEEMLTNDQVPEVAAMYFGVASPAAADYVGQRFKRQRIDEYGTAFTTANASGDGWRTRHDSFKWLLAETVGLLGIKMTTEVYGAFSRCIGQRSRRAWNRLSTTERKRQGFVPDFLVYKVATRMLADLKGMTCCKTRYFVPIVHSETRCFAADKRGAQVHEECVVKVRKCDARWNRTVPGQVGRFEQTFNAYGRVRGFVIGAFGEFSRDLNDFVKYVAKVGGERKWMSMGARSAKEASQILMTRNRRVLGIEAVRSHAELLLDRIALHVGGAGAAAAEARRKSGREAHWKLKEASWEHHRAAYGRHGG